MLPPNSQVCNRAVSVFDFEVKYCPACSEAAADTLSRQEFAGEPETDKETDFVDLLFVIWWGEGSSESWPGHRGPGVRQSVVEKESAETHNRQGNTHTLPGYTKEELIAFQNSNPTLKLSYQFFSMYSHAKGKKWNSGNYISILFTFLGFLNRGQLGFPKTAGAHYLFIEAAGIQQTEV